MLITNDTKISRYYIIYAGYYSVYLCCWAALPSLKTNMRTIWGAPEPTCFLRHKQNIEAETAWNYRNIKNNDLKGAMKCFNDRNWSGPIEGQITNPDC